MLRCQTLLSQFSGPNQVGGKFDAVSVLLAMIIHTQIRDYQGFATYWLELDMKWAFDIANHDVMLLTCYLAGAVGIEWMLLDDFIACDSVRIRLAGFISTAFHVIAGTAQGRKFSLHTFCAAFTWLDGIL